MSASANNKITTPDLEVRDVWKKADKDVAHTAQALWRALLPGKPREIEARTQNLCAAAYESEKIVAVSSAQPIDFGRLRGRFFYYRTAVAASARAEGLDVRLASGSKNILERWARENPDEKMKGIVMIFDTEEFASLRAHPFIREADFEPSLIGFTDQDHQIRVLWFDHVRLEN